MQVSLNALKSQNVYNTGFSSSKSNGISLKEGALKPGNGKALQAELNFMGVNNKILAFKGKSSEAQNDPYSFENFEIAREAAGIKTPSDVLKDVTPENLAGEGANSKVYKFSHPALDKWLIKIPKYGLCPHKIEDDLGNLNAGQEIGRVFCDFSIIKRLDGEPHSFKNWSYRAAKNDFGNVTRAEAREFATQLQKIADFPQSTFDDYAKQLKTLSDKGYKMDSINPNNLLIDYDNKKISIIDFAKDPNHKNSRLDLINSLLDFSFYQGIYRHTPYDDNEGLIGASEQIIEKCTLAAEKYDIPLDSEPYKEYLNYVDCFYNMGGGYSHMARYDYIARLFHELK